MVSGATFFTKSSLGSVEEVVGFQVPTKSIIHNSFHYFAEAGGEGDRTE